MHSAATGPEFDAFGDNACPGDTGFVFVPVEFKTAQLRLPQMLVAAAGFEPAHSCLWGR